MITDTDLKEKVAKLMSMAGTEGEAYCEWTINQIDHGLREAVIGATPDKVTVAIEALIDEGIVKKEERDSGKPQFVLANKVPPPEPLEQSPVMVQVDPKSIAAQLVPEEDLQARFQAQQQLQGLFARLDNLEEVMSELNRQVAALKEGHGALKQEVQAQNPRFAIAEARQELGRRIGKCEIQLEGLEQRYEALTKLIEKAVNATVAELTEDGVQVEDEEDELVVRVKELIGEWEATARDLVNRAATRPEAAVNEGAAKALRGCAVSLRNALDGTRDQWRDDAEPSDLALTLAKVLADHFDGLYGPFGNPMRRRTKTS